MPLQDVSSKSPRSGNHMVRSLDNPLFQHFQSPARPFTTHARDYVFFGEPAVVIENDLVSVERPDRQCESCRVQVVRMNHTNGFLAGDGAHFHKESGEFRAGHSSIVRAGGQFKPFGIAVEEQQERIQSTSGIQMLKLAKYSGAVAGLM